jgi:Bacterial SH3 domain
MTSPSALALRLGLGLAVLVLPAIDTGLAPWHGSAFAGTDEVAEKEAFEEAKSLGTVEAWDAFLAHYPNGFHADLARAYVKKLADQPQAAPTPSPPPGAAPTVSANDDFPVAAGSWGGVLRDGPGQQYRKIGSLAEGERVTLMARTDVMDGDFPWFKITTQSGQTGYQWGGILCSTGAERPGLFQTCPAAPSQSGTKVEPRCKNGGEWDGLRCRPAGYFNEPKSSSNNPPHKKKKKRCPAGEYLNQLGACQPNETGQ